MGAGRQDPAEGGEVDEVTPLVSRPRPSACAPHSAARASPNPRGPLPTLSCPFLS